MKKHLVSITKLDPEDNKNIYRFNFKRSTNGINKPMFIAVDSGIVTQITTRRPYSVSFSNSLQLKNRELTSMALHELIAAWRSSSTHYGRIIEIKPENGMYLTAYLLDLEEKHFNFKKKK